MPRDTLARHEFFSVGIFYSDAQLYRKIQLGTFPRPIGKNGRERIWSRADVDAWLAARAAKGRAKNAAA